MEYGHLKGHGPHFVCTVLRNGPMRCPPAPPPGMDLYLDVEQTMEGRDAREASLEKSYLLLAGVLRALRAALEAD